MSAQHCFIADPRTLDLRNMSAIVPPASIKLDDFGIGAVNLAFADLPERPSDFLEGEVIAPMISIDSQRFVDVEGEHSFHLSRLKPSGLIVFANLRADQFDDFVRRWCTFQMCDTFRYRKHPSSGVDDSTLQEQTQEALRRFLSVFCALCRQARAETKDIYVLFEWHEYLQPGALPNRAPGTSPGNSEVAGGPPSVS